MAFIVRNGIRKELKNLRWLLKNHRKIDYIIVDKNNKPGALYYDGVMRAILKDGSGFFQTTWNSLQVCREWLHRPVFIGVPLIWLGTRTEC